MQLLQILLKLLAPDSVEAFTFDGKSRKWVEKKND